MISTVAESRGAGSDSDGLAADATRAVALGVVAGTPRSADCRMPRVTGVPWSVGLRSASWIFPSVLASVRRSASSGETRSVTTLTAIGLFLSVSRSIFEAAADYVLGGADHVGRHGVGRPLDDPDVVPRELGADVEIGGSDDDRLRRNRRGLRWQVLHVVVCAKRECAAGRDGQNEHDEHADASHKRSSRTAFRSAQPPNAATIAPTAIAGAYANRLSADGPSISATLAPPVRTRAAVRSIVAPNRRRWSAITIASAPPAIAVYRNAIPIRDGPSRVPTAANSFTSPAPVAPIRWPGSIRSSPRANPANAPATLTPLTWVAAIVTPTAVIPIVSGFGTRRVYKSTTAPAPTLAATVATTMASEIVGNRLP